MNKISVIICTRNNCERLSKTLHSFLESEIPDSVKWELIIVSNGSIDNTKNVATSYSKKLPIVFAEEHEQGVSRARNKGFSIASGELIIFTDDDVTVNNHWISSYWKAYKDNPTGYYWGGPIVSEFETLDFDKSILDFAMPSVCGLDFGSKKRILDNNEFFIGPNWACPFVYLKQVGFCDITKGPGAFGDKVIAGDETDLMNRLKNIKLKGMYLPDAMVKHFVPKHKVTIKHIALRMRYVGIEEGMQYKNLMKNTIFGVPRWIFRKLITSYIKFIVNKMLFRPCYKEYLSINVALGIIDGIKM